MGVEPVLARFKDAAPKFNTPGCSTGPLVGLSDSILNHRLKLPNFKLQFTSLQVTAYYFTQSQKSKPAKYTVQRRDT
jgi:hypothetical protein